MRSTRSRRRPWGVVIAVAVAAAASASGSVVSGAASARGDVTINAFLFNEIGLGKQRYVALKNFTGRPASLGGLFLCQGTRCFALPATKVKPGKTARIATGTGAGLTNVVARRAQIGVLEPTSGEVALLAYRSPKDPRAMLAYLQWGSATHTLTSVAVRAGLWRKGSYVPSSPETVLLRRTAGGLWVYVEA